ncbi:related to RRP7 Protein involved in pre-rRNA processing and ribosome assembly [Rhynchosporium secalis]|uniref:Related to RRP7 Protein involved in pre-rRNA processing and ribosome assembly n=1 Tax=Rhynchosporium secalis TaxID=38038 RepID=A0A1E1LZE5_RHYSE|nr:related to RRP7 Protein involved in pre-rRNA processing and ribosome assembly [Rhynchosporium secalis]
MSEIKGYTVLPITIPSTPAYPKPTTHTIYLRPHAPKIPTENDSRSLFLVNVPIDATSAHLRAIFTTLLGAGRFESVSFEHENKTSDSTPTTSLALIGGKKRKRGDDVREAASAGLPQIWDRELRKSGSTAVVILVDSRSVEGALKAARKLGRRAAKGKDVEEGTGCVWGEGVLIGKAKDKSSVPALGSARYAAHHNLRFPNKAVLQANVDTFMTLFAAQEDAQAKAARGQRGVPDEDGFITVVRGGGARTGPARMEDAERKRVELEKKEEEKRKEGEMGGFYRFQGREKRKEEQGELVRRFEEDRRRVEGMREKGRKGFRPEN